MKYKKANSLLLALCLLCGMLPQLIPGTYAATIGDLSAMIAYSDSAYAFFSN